MRIPSHALTGLITLLLAILPPAPAPIRAQAATIGVDMPALAVTLAPGERRKLAVRISNQGSGPVQPLVYEANAASRTPSQLAVLTPLRTSLPPHRARIDPQITQMAAAHDGRVEVLVYLPEQADLSGALQISDWGARGTYVYQTLAAHAERTQAKLRAALRAQGTPFRPLWIVNAIRVRASQADLQALALRTDVALVQADPPRPIPAPEPMAADNSLCSPDDPSNPICWNIREIGADRVWDEYGVTGRGVTVATIDTGALVSHPALTRGYRGYIGSGLLSNDYNWYDPQRLLLSPGDTNGHGSHVLGIMAGRGDRASGLPAIGVAPGSTWIAAQGCESDCSEGDLIAAAEWMLAPTDSQGRNPRPDLRPMIINNSWAGFGGDPWYAGYIAAWRAAGIFPIFAAGNARPGNPAVCGSAASPGDDPQAVAVGALDANRRIAAFSLRGPSSTGGLKPDLSAPGTYRTGQLGIYSAAPGGSSATYQSLQGTSMAAPHVAGAVALLWSANPALIGNYDATYAAITGSASGLSDASCGEQVASPNNTYGYGALDAFAAVSRVHVDVPWLSLGTVPALAAGTTASLGMLIDAQLLPGPGTYDARIQIYPGDLGLAPTTITLSVALPDNGSSVLVRGVVSSAESGLPLAAQVGLVAGFGTATASDGSYALRLFPGRYTLVASALGYFSASSTIAVSSQSTQANFILRPDQPRMSARLTISEAVPSVSQSVEIPLLLDNTGTRTLTYQAFVIPEVFGVWRSDEPGGPQPGLITLPPDALELSVPATGTLEVALPYEFRFFNKLFRTIYIGSNGVVSFFEPTIGDQATTRCRPDQQLYLFAVAPFWANLDLSRGGRVRIASLPGGATIIGYEHVLLRDPTVSATYSFQVELKQDGRIIFRYGELGALPQQLAVGVQRVPGDNQMLGCGTDAALTSGLAVELRPQPAAQLWLRGDGATGSIPAGSQVRIALSADWYPPSAWPYRGRVRIVSSDPTHSVIDRTLTSAPIPAPYRVTLPVQR